ncbi:MAG: hypothetical protein K8U57_38115 [Planctomycetes bacterium]|nr:hypothetical protein [Planctomycetota bacterium]
MSGKPKPPVPWLLQLGPIGTKSATPEVKDPPSHPVGTGGGAQGGVRPSVADSTATNTRPGTSSPAPPGLPTDTLGLALSGGGIRSAAFCLGILQSLARSGWLRSVDFLSTVSGGGYVGAFLGRFFDLCAKPNGLTGAIPNRTPGAAQDRVAKALGDSRSAPIGWLRRNANYLSPSGLGETAANLAGFWRNLLSIYFVLAFFLFVLFGVLNAVGYGGLIAGPGSLSRSVIDSLTPVTTEMGYWTGPWAGLGEITVWLAVLPLMVAYWVVSQDLPEAYLVPVLAIAAILSGALLVATASPLGIVSFALAVVWSILAWAVVRGMEGHRDPFNPARLQLARNLLTRWLAFWLVAALVLLGFAALDGLGRWLVGLMMKGGLTRGTITRWLVSAATGVFGVAMTLRMAARLLLGSGASALSRVSFPYLRATAVLFLAAVPPLVAVSFASHIAYENGDAYVQGLAFTAIALVVSLLLGLAECVPFINRSGPLAIYAARLARAFFGAVNPERRTHPEGRNVAHVVPGDDVPFAEYAPHSAGGPLHLINCAVNETVDVASQRGLRDRQAENMAVGPAGVSVAQKWHGVWAVGPNGLQALEPLAPDGEPHPFLAEAGGPVEVESLNLREWVGISGAALDPGMGRRTGLARALLLTLANLRLGYWWNSGLDADGRRRVPLRRGLARTLGQLLSSFFQTQTLLLAELTGRFAGPWERYWHLSDGGNFEVTGAYELLRRRVPFVIVCDAGHDPDHLANDFATLVRLARIDLGAEFEDVCASPTRSGSPAERAAGVGVPSEVAARLGSLSDLLAAPGSPQRHAALYLVRYADGIPNPDNDPWLARKYTWLLHIKATLTGDEPADVRNYAALNPDFPNQTTLDQVFDEAQWESYRQLGDHIGEQLFVNTTQAGAS